MLTMRAPDVDRDVRRLCELLRAAPDAPLHPGDLQSKLSDPSLCVERDARVWEDGVETLGFAFVQSSCFELNFAAKQDARRVEVEARMMDWATERFERVACERGRLTLFFTSVREHDEKRIRLLEQRGFTRDEAFSVCLHRTLDAPLPPPELPQGFALRHIAGASEARDYTAAHRNAFWMENLTEEWHARVCDMPDYLPELNFVVVAPDGTFAACCLAWLERDGGGTSLTNGYVETIGTRLKFQKMGLGRAVSLEVLRRLQSFGAGAVVGHTDGGNAPALRLYESVGLRPLHRIYRYYWRSEVAS